MKKPSLAGLLFATTVMACTAAAMVTGCGGETCLDTLNVDCQPLYAPTFDNIYNNTLTISCAVSGSDCHGVAPGQAGLAFTTEDDAFAQLTGQADGVKRAIANDAECSLLIQRLESDDADVMMPPGGRLQEAERCAIIQWVAQGTPR